MKEALLSPKQAVQLGKPSCKMFIEGFSKYLGRRERRYWCCKYLEGLLMPGERKSIQSISQRVADGNVQALHQFVCNSPWSAHQLSLGLSNWLVKQASQSQPGLLILDDTICLVPWSDLLSYVSLPTNQTKEELWDRYYMGAPKRQRLPVEQSKIVKRA